MTERQAAIAFNLTECVGSCRAEALKAAAGSLAAAWERFPHKSARSGGEVDWQAEVRRAEKTGVTILTDQDDDYPERLRAERGHPLVLYVRGSVAALSQPSVALVGTRRSTAYGRACANRLGFELAQAGWSVVSGLALGIDAEAHRGALTARGVTVGVIGSGLDRFYPEANLPLAKAIIDGGGAVVSQFPFGRPPDRETFPIRNQVVAALARGVVAVESPIRGGTLITTGIAAELGRIVMAIPSRVDSPMSAGCNQLIREGATLVRNADDVLEALGELRLGSQLSGASASEASEPTELSDPGQPKYSAEEALVMMHVDEAGIELDRLVELTGLPVARVHSLAMLLRLKGFVKFLPGNRISLLTASPGF